MLEKFECGFALGRSAESLCEKLFGVGEDGAALLAAGRGNIERFAACRAHRGFGLDGDDDTVDCLALRALGSNRVAVGKVAERRGNGPSVLKCDKVAGVSSTDGDKLPIDQFAAVAREAVFADQDLVALGERDVPGLVNRDAFGHLLGLDEMGLAIEPRYDDEFVAHVGDCQLFATGEELALLVTDDDQAGFVAVKLAEVGP